MKKLIAFVVIVASLFSLNFFSDSTLGEKFFDNAICYYAYVTKLINVNCDEFDVVQNGSGAIIKTTINKAKKILISGSTISGECVEVEKNFGLSGIIKTLNLTIVTSRTINNKMVLEGYSNFLPTFVTSQNKKINIQIAETENSYLVGYPLILHSY